jgi:hypothetical protein
MDDRVAYYEQCAEPEKRTPAVVILDLDGKRLQSFQPQAQAMPPARLVGLGFTPSPDNQRIAHIGQFVHFAPPFARSNYLLIDNTTVYPLPKGAKPTGQRPFEASPDVLQESDSKTIGIHEFTAAFSWSPDSRRVAFID